MRYLAFLLLLLTACAVRTNSGPRGLPGVSGPTGSQGEAGVACVIQNSPAGAVVACSDGTAVIVANGLPGVTGPAGAQGVTGPTGADSTPLTVIQLCPGATTYPSVFLEYAFCLQNQLYGVFSVNGGYLGLIPPGSYSSNAIGSACALTVGPGCQVTHP